MKEDDQALRDGALEWLAIRKAGWRRVLAEAPRGRRHDICVEQMRTIDEIRNGLLGRGDATPDARTAAVRTLLDDRAENEASAAMKRIAVAHALERREGLRAEGASRTWEWSGGSGRTRAISRRSA